MTIETDANDLDGPATPAAPVIDDSALKIGDGFGDGGDGLLACQVACTTIPGARPFYGINASPSRSPHPASARNWQWSIAAPPPKPAIDWSQFLHLPSDGEFTRNLKDARKLLALRTDRGAPDHMIEFARFGLEGIEHKINSAVAARNAPPATGLVASMSPGVRAAAGLSMAAFFTVFILKHALHPIPYAPPPARIPVPGPGVGIQQDIFIPATDPPAKQSSTRERYSAPYTVTRTTPKGVSSTQHGSRYTVTTTR